MSDQRIGTCSICGGDVVAHIGPWMAVVPPPPPTCKTCGAMCAEDLIYMKPVKYKRWIGKQFKATTGDLVTDFTNFIKKLNDEKD